MLKNVVIIVFVIIITAGTVLYFTRDKDSESDQNGSSSTGQTEQAETTITKGLVLDYSNQGLTEFPKEALSQTSAVELNLSGNSLSGALPSEIGKLTKLEILNVSDNNMTGIPAEIGQLSKLKILNYANNQITGLPNELGNLNNLEIFDLSGNNPSQQDLENIRSSLPSSTQIIL